MMTFVDDVVAMSVPVVPVVSSPGTLDMQVYLALIALVGTVLTITMPTLTAWLVNRNTAKIKKADYERQDLVAKRILDAAERQERIAAEAAERAERVARENASLLLIANAQIVASSLRNGEKLDILKVQGDGQMTAILSSELHIAKIAMKSLLEGIAKDKALGNVPDVDTLAEVKSTENRITELKMSIENRIAQEKIIAKMPGEPLYGENFVETKDKT